MFANPPGHLERGWVANGGEQYDLSSEVDFTEQEYPRIQFEHDLSRRGTPDSTHTGADSPVIEDGKSAQSSWTNPSYISSIPWGAQVQKRQLDRATTPIQLEHEYAGTTMVPSTESASSLHKQVTEEMLSGQYSSQRLSPSPIVEVRGFHSVEIPTRSTDSFALEDSPLITSLNFPSPPAKPSHLSLSYGSRSQVTPPARRPITPEPAEPTTPTMLSPETGRFQGSSKSYPSPVQAGFRSPSSRYGAESSGGRSVSGPNFQSARALDFDNNITPTRLMQFTRDRSRSDSFGSNAEDLQRSMARTTATRMPGITEAGLMPDRHSGYGFEVPDFAVHDFDPLSPTTEGRIRDGVSDRPFRTPFPLHLESANETPNLSLSELVSSPPSVDTGADYDINQTTLVTPEGRHFPDIHSPRAQGNQWTSSGVIGLGEGIAGGPQRDERGKRINLRRWRKADPMMADNPRTAVDVYTNGEPEKQKPGFKKRFSQSVLNLLGEAKKAGKNGEAPITQPKLKAIKKESGRSVTDLLGLSRRTRPYDWNQPQASQAVRAASTTRLNPFKRSESTPVNLSGAASSGPSSLAFLQRSHRDLSSQETRKQITRLPASPSMPALSATLNRKSLSDLRIQDWLNASQAALHDTRSSRYDFGTIDRSDDVYQYATGPKSPSIASRILSRRPESRLEVKEEGFAPSLNLHVAIAEDPAASHTLLRPASGHIQTAAVDLESAKRGKTPTLDAAADLSGPRSDSLSGIKSRKKRTPLSRLSSWLGIGGKNSKKYSAQEQVVPENDSSRVTTPAINPRLRPAEMDSFTRQNAPSPDVSTSASGAPWERDPQQAKKRRSGSDWLGLGSVGWRRWENGPQAASALQREPHIVLLSSEHLPPPTMNAQGFLQSSASVSTNTTPIAQPLRRFSPESQNTAADFAFLDTALLAPRMERDLSRLSERDEEASGERQQPPKLPAFATTLPAYAGRSTRKPPPTAFLEMPPSGVNSLAVPPSGSRRRRSSNPGDHEKVLSITSLSSLSTGIVEGEDHGATIQTVLASPIHNQTPYSGPIVSRGVSLDLSALTDAERSAIGFGTIPRSVIAN